MTNADPITLELIKTERAKWEDVIYYNGRGEYCERWRIDMHDLAEAHVNWLINEVERLQALLNVNERPVPGYRWVTAATSTWGLFNEQLQAYSHVIHNYYDDEFVAISYMSHGKHQLKLPEQTLDAAKKACEDDLKRWIEFRSSVQ